MSDPSNLPPLPANHLSHPENWATGSEPVTGKQEGFIKVLEGQKPDLVPEGGIDTSKLSKSDASDVIDKLKNGKPVDEAVNDSSNHVENGGKPSSASKGEEEKEETSTSSKRKEPTTDESSKPASLEDAQADGGSASTGTTSTTGEVKKDATEEKKEDGPAPAKKAKKDENGENDEKKVEGTTAEEAIEIDTPSPDKDAAPSKPAQGENGSNGKKAGNGAAKKEEETVPGDESHLDHPENWATGDQPATDKQKGFIKVLEQQKGATGVVEDVEHLGKSEASEKIEELKSM